MKNYTQIFEHPYSINSTFDSAETATILINYQVAQKVLARNIEIYAGDAKTILLVTFKFKNIHLFNLA